MNLAKFPRRGYVTDPTPLEYLPNFSKALGGKVSIYIKRDDLLPGTAGGNKTRKLDFVMADALAQGDFDAFLNLAKASGISSWTMLQNVCPAGATKEQAVSVALAVAQAALKGRGGCRVHGGGFAGTIQAFVPVDLLDSFKAETERVLGQGRCHVLSIRSVGGCVVAG